MADGVKCEVRLNMTLNEVLDLTRPWLLSNEFKLKKETVKGTKAITVAMIVATSETRHSLVIRIIERARNCSVTAQGTDEALQLATFLQSQSQPHSPQQQQIVVNAASNTGFICGIIGGGMLIIAGIISLVLDSTLAGVLSMLFGFLAAICGATGREVTGKEKKYIGAGLFVIGLIATIGLFVSLIAALIFIDPFFILIGGVVELISDKGA